MTDRKHANAWMSLLVLAMVAPAQAQNLDDVETKIIESGKKIKSFTADVTMKSQMQQAGMTMESNATGTIELLRRGDKTLWRMEQKTSTVTEMGGQKQNTEMSTLTIMDGQFTYVLMEQAGQKQVIKTKAEPGQPTFAAKDTFDQLRKDNDLKILPEPQVNGKDAYVIEATPKDKSQPIAKQMLYFDKHSGMLLKMEALDATGKPMHTSTFRNFKMNIEIKPERFKFVAPEGVQVIDMTRAGTPNP